MHISRKVHRTNEMTTSWHSSAWFSSQLHLRCHHVETKINSYFCFGLTSTQPPSLQQYSKIRPKMTGSLKLAPQYVTSVQFKSSNDVIVSFTLFRHRFSRCFISCIAVQLVFAISLIVQFNLNSSRALVDLELALPPSFSFLLFSVKVFPVS